MSEIINFLSQNWSLIAGAGLLLIGVWNAWNHKVKGTLLFLGASAITFLLGW